jgi:hypothetical protein
MKKMLLAAAALALIASPALAQSGSRKAAPTYGAWQPPFGAYGQQRSGAFVPSYGRTLGKDYVGTDPDPSIRLQLLRDAESRE